MPSRKGDPNGPYWIRVRAFERTLLRNAFVTAGRDQTRAARFLKIPISVFVGRATLLGGVIDDTPNEPFQFKFNRKPRNKPQVPATEGDLDDLDDDTRDDSNHEDLING